MIGSSRRTKSLLGGSSNAAVQDVTRNANAAGGDYTEAGISALAGKTQGDLIKSNIDRLAQINAGNIASDQSRQNAGQDLIQGQQSGDYGLLGDLLKQGGISNAQRGQATNRYNDVLAQLRTASGYAGNMAQNGLYSDTQRAGYMDNFNTASNGARDMAANGGYSNDDMALLNGNYNDVRGKYSEFSDNGGYSDADMNLLNGNYSDVRNRYTGLADNGALRAGEYQQSLASGRQDVMDSFKNAAESTFNQSNAAGKPFAGTAVMTEGAREAGANMARVRADLDKYQADTRMKGIEGLSGVANDQAGFYGDRAKNKLASIEGLSGVANDQAGLYSDRAGNRLAGTSELGSLAGEYGDYLKTDAGGKLEAINQLNSIANSGLNASDSLAKIDTMAGEGANQGLMDKLQERLGYQSPAALEARKKGSKLGGQNYNKKRTQDINVGTYNPYTQGQLDQRLKYNSGSRV